MKRNSTVTSSLTLVNATLASRDTTIQGERMTYIDFLSGLSVIFCIINGPVFDIVKRLFMFHHPESHVS